MTVFFSFNYLEKVKAEDFSKYSSSVIVEVSTKEIKHTFNINSSAHSVGYQQSFDYEYKDDGNYTHHWTFYKMTDSDYFSPNENYLFSNEFVGGNMIINHFIYKKTNQTNAPETVPKDNSGNAYEKVPTLPENGYLEKYINYVNSNPTYTRVALTEYMRSLVPDNIKNNLEVHNTDENKAPFIEAGGATFRFTYLISKNGAFTEQDNIIMFTYESGNSIFNGYAIELSWDARNGKLVKYNDINDYSDELPVAISDLKTKSDLALKNVVNKIYNEKSTNGSGNKCGRVVSPDTAPREANWEASDEIQASCINLNGTTIDKNGHPPSKERIPIGWMAKWGIKGNEASFSDPNGSGYEGECDFGYNPIENAIKSAFCALGVALREFATSLMNKAFDLLGTSLGVIFK
jgi:hypothetical protein